MKVIINLQSIIFVLLSSLTAAARDVDGYLWQDTRRSTLMEQHLIDDSTANQVNKESLFLRKTKDDVKLDNNAVQCRGGCPPDPPSVGDVTGSFTLSLFSSRKDFWRMSGIIFLARALELQETTSNKWRA